MTTFIATLKAVALFAFMGTIGCVIGHYMGVREPIHGALSGMVMFLFIAHYERRA